VVLVSPPTRYCAICHPLSKNVEQKYLLLGSLIFAVLYNIPKFFETRIVEMPSGEVSYSEPPLPSEVVSARFVLCSKVNYSLQTRLN